MNSFSYLEQEKIINFVHQFPYIWDLANEDYHDNKKRDLVFAKIGKLLNRSPDDVQKCWTALRTKYIRIKKEMKSNEPKSGSAGGRKHKQTSWGLYQILSFLDGTFRKRLVTESTIKNISKITNTIYKIIKFHIIIYCNV